MDVDTIGNKLSDLNKIIEDIQFKLSLIQVKKKSPHICFIPILLILTTVVGLPGVQQSRAIADVLSFFVAAPFAIRYVGQLKEAEKKTLAAEV